MAASLDPLLLSMQLRRGGWWTYARDKLGQSRDGRRVCSMSRYLSLECFLAGNQATQTSSQHLISYPETQCISVDFTTLKDWSPKPEQVSLSSPTVGTTSLCGKYYVTSVDSEIFAYSIDRDSLRLMSRTPCEQRVLAMAIHAGSGRLAIAALLERRVGLYIDLMDEAKCPPTRFRSLWETAGSIRNVATETDPVMDLDSGDASNDFVGDRSPGGTNATVSNAATFTTNEELQRLAESVPGPTRGYTFDRRIRPHGLRQTAPRALSNDIWQARLNLERIEREPPDVKLDARAVYRNICTAEDPPHSVAISPTRQCVAFGNKTGVELYWVRTTSEQPFICKHDEYSQALSRLIQIPARVSTDGFVSANHQTISISYHRDAARIAP